MGDLRQEYRFLAPQLVEAGCRVAWMDVRGHGESSIGWQDVSVAGVGSDMLALIRHLDAGPALLYGASMAAGAAAWAAAEDPGAIRGLVLSGPFVRNEPVGTDKNTGRLYGLMFGVLLSRPWGPAIWSMYYNSLYPTRKPDDLAAYRSQLRANLAQPGRLESLQAMLRADKNPSEERLARVNRPVLVLMGEKDPDFKDPAAEAEWIGRMTGGTVHILPNAGHYPQVEYPEETAALVATFSKSLE
jgi:pimeloyl-ACP methyl ester carboxylesterase